MLKKISPAFIALALVASCGGPGGESSAEYDYAMEAPAQEVAVSGSRMAMSDDSYSEPSPAPDRPDVEPGPQQYIAYSHSLGLRLPKGSVEPMLQGHVEDCRTAGTETCIVINSNVYNSNEDYVSGNVSIRATPDWIETFLGGVEAETEAADGEITSRSTRAEDLTRSIIDTGARLDAQRTLRSRLEGLLERRDGTLGDLLQIERELARVIGEIESTEAQLRALRLRVSMSSLDVSYETKVPAFSGSRSNPLGEAIGDFFFNLSSAIAAVITAFAVGLPWLVLIGIFLWIWLKLFWPWIRRKRPTKASKP
nr:DUF4349 domain-containing protein [Henriciella sp.]